MGVPQLKPMHGFSPNFQGMFTPRGSKANYVMRGIQPQHGNTFKILECQRLWVFHSLNLCPDFHQIFLNFVGVPQPKPMHGFSPNFQDMFTQEDLELIMFWGIFGHNCCHGNSLKIFGSHRWWVFHSLNPCMDFHQIFRIC